MIENCMLNLYRWPLWPSVVSSAQMQLERGTPLSDENKPSAEQIEIYNKMMAVAIEQARYGRTEGGIPIGAAVFTRDGHLVSRGHNRRVQQNDPSMHGETDAFRAAGRQKSYKNLIMVTTLAPCWYCSGLVRQFGFGMVIVGESRTFKGGIDWLRENGIEVVDLDSGECRLLLEGYIAENPEIWHEDIGVE